MKLLKEALMRGSTNINTQDIHTYVTELHKHLAKTCCLAQENISAKQPCYKRNFDHELAPGQQVLLLRPTYNNQMLMHCWGPYHVVQWMKQNDYLIQVGTKSKVYH